MAGMPSDFVYVEDDYYEDSPEDLYLNEDRVRTILIFCHEVWLH